jgi:hypothetical protein
MALEKVFLLPPLKGLNLYDNPFTMSPDFAVDLTNFMPPTTTFTVRPGVTRIVSIAGQVRGIYSYSTGSTINYGENWYNSNIEYGAASVLLVKILSNNGSTKLTSIDPLSKTVSDIGEVANSYYNDSSVMFKHTLFLASGEKDSAVYLYHQAKGLATFALSIGDDGSSQIGNISNVVIFKNYIFFSTSSSSNVPVPQPDPPDPDPDPHPEYNKTSTNALNIFFIQTRYADILDPLNNSWWNTITNFFSPKFGSSFSLDGALQNGGSIIRLCTISRSGSDTVDSYLAAITDQGEIVLFDGTDPTDLTGEKWKIVGHFQIPPPLNKWGFADMEGDLIVVTKNGLVSLRRIIFGQVTNITDNLEYRIMSLFKNYMFTIPSFSQFVGLYYYQRNRLLIFNVPTDLPMPFNQIVTTYNFDKNKSLTFPFTPVSLSDPASNVAAIPEEIIEYFTNFINSYIVKNLLNYSLIIEFNGDHTKNSISIDIKGFVNETSDTATTVPGTITCNFGITIGSKFTSFFYDSGNIKYNVANLEDQSCLAVLDDSNKLFWREDLYNYVQQQVIYKFNTTDDLIVTNILPSSSYFYNRHFSDTLAFIKPGTDITDKALIYCSKNFYNITDTAFIQSIDSIFRSKDMGWLTNNTGRHPIPSTVYFADETNRISPFKLILLAFNGISKNPTEIPKSHAIYKYPLYVEVDDIAGKIYYDFTVTLEYSFCPDESDNYSYVNFTIGDTTNMPNSAFYTVSGQYNIESDEQTYEFIYYTNITTFGDNINKNILFNHDKTTFILDSTKNYGWTYTNIPQDVLTDLSAKLENYLPQDVTKLDFVKSIGYLFSNFNFGKNPEIYPNKAAIAGDDPYSSLTNIDLSMIPIFNNINIVCNFASTQYVFDSHFGTWSTFKDVNMVRGIEHANDFYFIVPDNISYKQTTGNSNFDYVITSSTLCKFSQDQKGDMKDINVDPTKQTFYPIQCSYKTVPTFDLGSPRKKFFKRLKIFGTASTFWQTPDATTPKYNPLEIIPYWDFKEGSKCYFIHFDDANSISEIVMKKHFKEKKFNELSFIEKMKFWKKYTEENDMLSFINIPINCNPSTRFGLEMNLIMNEAYMDIYGFEIFFEPSNNIL